MVKILKLYRENVTSSSINEFDDDSNYVIYQDNGDTSEINWSYNNVDLTSMMFSDDMYLVYHVLPDSNFNPSSYDTSNFQQFDVYCFLNQSGTEYSYWNHDGSFTDTYTDSQGNVYGNPYDGESFIGSFWFWVLIAVLILIIIGLIILYFGYKLSSKAMDSIAKSEKGSGGLGALALLA